MQSFFMAAPTKVTILFGPGSQAAISSTTCFPQLCESAAPIVAAGAAAGGAGVGHRGADEGGIALVAGLADGRRGRVVGQLAKRTHVRL